MRDLSEFRSCAKKRWWFIAIQAAIAVFVVCLALAVVGDSSSKTTTHLVLRPASSLPAPQVPGAIDGLRPDGSLVQTVLHVLGSDRLMQTAVAASKPSNPSRYSISATVQPGSAFFDQSVVGPDAPTVQKLAEDLSVADSVYIRGAYSAYSLDLVGTDVSTDDSFPPKPAIVLLALMLGVAFGLATLFADWWFLEPRRARARAAGVNLDDRDRVDLTEADAGPALPRLHRDAGESVPEPVAANEA
jgi:hypothetical protein